VRHVVRASLHGAALTTAVAVSAMGVLSKGVRVSRTTHTSRNSRKARGGFGRSIVEYESEDEDEDEDEGARRCLGAGAPSGDSPLRLGSATPLALTSTSTVFSHLGKSWQVLAFLLDGGVTPGAGEAVVIALFDMVIRSGCPGGGLAGDLGQD
jgi:hypothetical protein